MGAICGAYTGLSCPPPYSIDAFGSARPGPAISSNEAALGTKKRGFINAGLNVGRDFGATKLRKSLEGL